MQEATIEGQIALEQTMVDRGAKNYLTNQQKARENGRAADLDYSRALMQEYMEPLIDSLVEDLKRTGPAKNARARVLLRRADPASCMYIAMRNMFNTFSFTEEPLVQTCIKIGKQVEDEIRFVRFQEEFGNYYEEIIQDFKRKGTKDYRYMQRVLTHSANNADDLWESWTQSERADVGARLLDQIIEGTDLCDKQMYYVNGKTKVVLKPTEEAIKWINEHEAIQQFLYPDRAPCIIEPDKWTGLFDGGYYTPRLRTSTPLVKTSGSRQKTLIKKAKLDKVIEAVNAVQATSWQVNHEVLAVLKEAWARNMAIAKLPNSQKLEPRPCPFEKGQVLTEAEQEVLTEWKHEAAVVYTAEKDRIAKGFQVARILRLANDYAGYDKFWYVWYADFRGRLYTATATYSPQGPDIAKGLLRFGEGKPLGERGWYWLRVHIANRFGYDKVSYDDRVEWVDSQREQLLLAAADPLNYRDIWTNADKPWQFLAAIMEYRDALVYESLGQPVVDFVSRIPIGLDGSCNGLQNFSAMLRDPIGGAATNLVPSDIPADIYTKVGEVCLEHLKQMYGQADPLIGQWIAWADKYGGGKLPRKLSKRPVMTLPYGATRQSCSQYIFQHILETDSKFFPGGAFKAAVWLTPILWKSIGEVVVAARDAMAWLQQAAGVMAKYNKPCIWQVADGFIATQHSRELTTHKIRTQLQGAFQLRIGTYNDNINKYKQRSGIAPNFIHSQDALHLRTTVRLAVKRGISSLACIHDDYGTHACDTDLLHKCIRDAFVVLYSKGDPLASFKAQQEATGTKLPALPMKGELDITQVSKSEYFFG